MFSELENIVPYDDIMLQTPQEIIELTNNIVNIYKSSIVANNTMWYDRTLQQAIEFYNNSGATYIKFHTMRKKCMFEFKYSFVLNLHCGIKMSYMRARLMLTCTSLLNSPINRNYTDDELNKLIAVFENTLANDKLVKRTIVMLSTPRSTRVKCVDIDNIEIYNRFLHIMMQEFKKYAIDTIKNADSVRDMIEKINKLQLQAEIFIAYNQTLKDEHNMDIL